MAAPIDSTIQLPTVGDTTGPKVDSTQITVGATAVQRERMNIADPAVAAGLAGVLSGPPVGTEYGLVTRPVTDPQVIDLLQRLILEIRALRAAVLNGFNATGLGLTRSLDPGDYPAEAYADAPSGMPPS